MDRFTAVDYALIYPLPIHLLSPLPEPYPGYWNFVKPFTPQIWMTLFGVLIFVVVFWKLMDVYVLLKLQLECKFSLLDIFKSQFNQSNYGILIILYYIFKGFLFC